MEKIWPYKIIPNETISSEIGEISFNSDGILVVRYKNNLDFTLNKAKSFVKTCDEITNGNKVFTMIVTGEHGYMTTETREYLSGEEVAKHRKAVALVVDNLPHRIIAGFIVRVRQNYYPTQVFKKEENALLWLEKQQLNYGL